MQTKLNSRARASLDAIHKPSESHGAPRRCMTLSYDTAAQEELKSIGLPGLTRRDPSESVGLSV